jgi:23S rRNA (pseudouridine1915-N3)-methyltransferase
VKVVMISVGSPKAAGLAAAIEEYESRIPHYFKFDSLEIRPQRITQGADQNSIIEKESEALLSKVADGSEIVAVDQRGSSLSSEELARYLDGLAVGGRRGVAFLIGGALGLSESLRTRSNRLLSLSSFTLPHEMARLVLAEQLYRAGTILRGEPYHKAG